MAQWFIVRDGNEDGPFSSAQLKEMAAAGKLRHEDLVRRDDMPTPRQASAMKGLFAAGESAPTSPHSRITEDSPPPAAEKKSTSSKKPLLLLSILGGACLFLCCGGLGLIAMLGMRVEQTTRKQLAEADDLWDKGDKAGAVGKYRDIIDGSRARFLKEEDRPRAYGRVIDADMEQGNAESAKKLIAEATRNKVTPQVSHPDAKAMLAASQKEQLAKTEQGFKWQQPEGWWGDALKSSDLRFRPMPVEDYGEIVAAFNSKNPEKVAKLLQHVDPHTLFTQGELKVMMRPYYGIQRWSGDVLDTNHPDPYTEVQSKSGHNDTFREPLFLVSGDPDQSIGGMVSGTFYRSHELKEEKRTKFVQKAIMVKLDFIYSGPNLKKTGIKAARLQMIVVHIPAIFNDEKCYGWDAMIVAIGSRVGSVRFIERRAEKFGIMADPKFGPSDSEYYRINYNADEYEIEKLVPKREIIKGR